MIPIIITLIIAALYLPSLTTYFSADDWFHLNISQITSTREFFNFFSFYPNENSAAFYRPLPTQIFFYIFQNIFNLNPTPYHIFVLSIFTINLYLLYLLSKSITKNNYQSILVLIFYGISVSNFTRVYYLSAFQEILLVFFCLLSIIFSLKKYTLKNQSLSLVFFIAALLSKETAVTLPFIIILINWFQRQLNFKKIIPYLLILFPYLYFRFIVFGVVQGDSYLWTTSPIKVFNTLFWYILWSVGAPETLVDYVGPNLSILPKFFSDFGVWSYIIIFFLLINLLIIGLLFLKNILKFLRELTIFLCLFVIPLTPVLFLPWHKFTLELGLPLIGFSLFLSQLLKTKTTLNLIGITLFLFLNLSMYYFTFPRHYAITRGKITKNINEYFLKEYPIYPNNSYFEFINDTNDYGSDWGMSKQVSHSTSGSNLFQVVYKDKNIKVYFEDIVENRPAGKNKIKISTKQFLN